MSITRNRELSQFGSFIHIDDITQKIGITSLSTPFVGIGTTNPGFKLDVNGDINLTGTFRQSGSAFEGSRFTVGTGSSIYRLQGNVGIGTSTLPQKLTVVGNVSAGQFISTVTSGTAPLTVLSDTQVTNINASFLRGKTPPTGDIVGTTDTQTLTNKTLTSPTINTAIIGSAGITFNGTSGTTTLQASATASGTLTLPAATDTLVGRDTSDTLTNKSIAAGSNTITGLTNSNLSGSAGISNANLANSTISGVLLGSNLNALTFTDYLTSGGTYTGATARTVSVAGTSINTGNTLVARDPSGDFTAGTVTLSGLTLSGALVISNATESTDKDTGCLILQGGIGVEKNANIGGALVISNATQSIDKDTGCLILGGGLGVEKNANIGGTLKVTGITTCAGGLDVTGDITASGTVTANSDEKLKENVITIENALEKVLSLRGVEYDRIDSGDHQIGVIAQEVEKVVPAVVYGDEIKSVAYGNLVGLLIEAIKEQQKEIEEMKKTINKNK